MITWVHGFWGTECIATLLQSLVPEFRDRVAAQADRVIEVLEILATLLPIRPLWIPRHVRGPSPSDAGGEGRGQTPETGD